MRDEGGNIERHINDELERAMWAVEDQRLEPLANVIRGLPGVTKADGYYFDGITPRHRQAEYLGVGEDDISEEPDRWMVSFTLAQNEDGWATLGVLGWVFNDNRVLKDVEVSLYPYAPCACHNDPREHLTFVIESTSDPEAVARGVEEVVSGLLEPQ
jgi:hypothetical protein